VLNLKSCEMQHPAADRLVTEVLSGLTAREVRGYPYHLGLMERLAEIGGTAVDDVLLTAGSCGAIALVVDGYAQPAGRLLAQEPVFDSWLHYAALRGVPVTRCAGLAGSPPEPVTDELVAAMRTGPPAVVAITDPGNPAGLVLPVPRIAELAEVAAEHGHLLVVDECYGAFTGTDHVPLVGRFPNVLVLRSLSKSWALAGARLAAVFGPAPVIDYLRRFRTDSAVSAPAVALATGIAARLPELRGIWRDVTALRDGFATRVLADHPGWTALRPGGNFVTFATGVPGGGHAVERALAARGIRVRGLDDVAGLAGCVRLSLADRDRMAGVADVLRDVA
jgi:histidinol-phosphate/aromatic aminotransferase/cobyric acid decarboxylase-like protein